MSQSRRIFREYAQSKGKEAKEFVEIKSEIYENDYLITMSNGGKIERTSIDYRDMIHWINRTYKLEKKNK